MMALVKLNAEGGGMSRKECIFAVLLLSAQAAAQAPVQVLQNPAAGASQSIVQLPDTTTQRNPSIFSVNNEAGIRYVVSSYNWPTQTPNVTLMHGVQATLTLSPCPAGLVAPFTRIWIADGGKSEAVALSATQCALQGTDQDSITFTPMNDHTAGQYTLGPASQGIQEAINAANSVSTNFPNQLGKVIIPPGDYTAKARVSILGNKQYIDANGAVLTCTMADTCVFVGDTGSSNTTWDVTIDGLLVRPGLAPGIPLAKFPAIEDNGMHTTLRGIGTRDPSSAGPVFFTIIQVDNDQAAVIEKFDPSRTQGWAHCGTDWCSVAIYGPGPFGTNAGVIWVKDSNISGQCAFNGIDNQDANTLRVSDTIVQGYPQFGIRAVGSNTNAAATLDNVYMEVGDCTNPLGLGIAGFISEGFTSVMHSTEPAGVLPQLMNTGSTTTYVYYVVVHGTPKGGVAGISAPYLVGYASFGSVIFNVTVNWPQLGSNGTTGISYDLLRQTLPTGATPGSGAPYGTGAFAVATGITGNCSNGVCFAVDSGTLSTYTVTSPSTFAPALTFWPGSVILTELTDSGTTNGGEPRLYADIVGLSTSISLGGFVNSYGANVPTVFAHQCSSLGGWSSIWMSCAAGDSVSSNFPAVGALLLQSGGVFNGGHNANLKGRLNFLLPSGDMPGTHLITLADSNPAKTLATPGHRPFNDANDTWIGLDNANLGVSSFQLAFGAPVSISSYIGNIGDNTSWLERLTGGTSPLKSFQVPITTNSQIRSTLQTSSTLPPFSVQSTVPVQTLVVANHPTLQNCGTTGTCSSGGFTTPNGQIVFGTLALSNGSATLMGISPPFHLQTSFNCVANDVTNLANAVKAVPASASSVTFTGTGSNNNDTISYMCVGSETQ